MKNKVILLLLIIIQNAGCGTQSLDNKKETAYGTFYYCDNDTVTIKDLVQVTEDMLPRICRELSLTVDKAVVVEIYPVQQEYNANIINRDLINTPAISGSGKIQMVSPLAKIKIDSIKYNDRLMFLVHEYIHILIDNLENAPPVCIDEGIASFYSSYNFYKSAAVKYVKEIKYIPSIKQLFEHYSELPAPDLFSFVFIDFMIQEKGKIILPELLKNPELAVNDDLENSWNNFVKRTYY